MSKQVRYVVLVDLESKRVYTDDEAYTERFHEWEGTYDTKTDQWKETNWADHIKALKILNKEAK